MQLTLEKLVFKKKKDAYRVNLEYFVPKASTIVSRHQIFLSFSCPKIEWFTSNL